MLKARIAVIVSGGGTNLQALIDCAGRGEMPHGEIVLVVADKAGVGAIARAEKTGTATSPTAIMAIALIFCLLLGKASRLPSNRFQV